MEIGESLSFTQMIDGAKPDCDLLAGGQALSRGSAHRHLRL
jgi:hypothetical protein